MAKVNLGQLNKGLTSEELTALLREREAGGDQRTLRDIYDYIDNQGNAAFAITPNNMSGGEQGWGSTGPGLEFTDPQANNGADGNQRQDQYTFDPGELFRHGITLSSNAGHQGEGSGGFRYMVDGSKFPTTRFGDVTQTAPVDDGTRLRNPNLRYNDENYGDITHHQNVRINPFNQYFMQALMTGAMGGISALGAPALATQLVSLGRTLGMGGDPTSILLRMVGGQLGLPGWTTQLASLALGQLNRGSKP